MNLLSGSLVSSIKKLTHYKCACLPVGRECGIQVMLIENVDTSQLKCMEHGAERKAQSE